MIAARAALRAAFLAGVEHGDGWSNQASRENAVGTDDDAAIDYANESGAIERPALTADEVRAVVLYHANDVLQSQVPELSPLAHHDVVVAIATRVAKQLAGSTVADQLSDIVRRLHQTSERAPDVRAVPMRLVHQSVFDELLARVGDLSATSQPAALTAQPEVGQTPEQQIVRVAPDDTAIIDQALGYWSSDYNDAPHEDIARIRAALTGTVLS